MASRCPERVRRLRALDLSQNLGSSVNVVGGSVTSPATSSLTAGSHTVTANFSGGTSFASSSGSLTHHFGFALGWPGEAAGAGFSVALDAPSQSQASARRDRILETLPRLNNESYGAPW